MLSSLKIAQNISPGKSILKVNDYQNNVNCQYM